MKDNVSAHLLDHISVELQQKGYEINFHPAIPGAPGLLYARSMERISLGFAKVEDHFIFVDWDCLEPDRLAQVKTIYQNFNAYVNQGFKVPHAWRLTIPNMVVIAISQSEFPAEAIAYASNTGLDPWYGGEVGQVMLVDVGEKQIFYLASLNTGGRFPRPGALPLGHASRLIREMCERAFSEA